MQILVSGGDGFIGRHLCQRLLDRGDSVHVVDNHITSQPEIIHPLLTRSEIDVAESVMLPEDFQPDAFVHLASVAIPSMYMDSPELVIRPNVVGTQTLCEAAHKLDSRVLFASTSEVYGAVIDAKPFGTQIDEFSPSRHGLLNPRSSYATAKRMGEEIVRSFRLKGMNTCCLRLFNVVGPGMDVSSRGYGRVIPNFVKALNRREPLPIFGEGEQSRSFLWIDDAVEAIIRLIDFPNTMPECINIGHDEQVTVMQLANRLISISKIDPGLIHMDSMPDEPVHRRPNIEFARELLGWSPTVNLDEILHRIVSVEIDE